MFLQEKPSPAFSELIEVHECLRNELVYLSQTVGTLSSVCLSTPPANIQNVKARFLELLTTFIQRFDFFFVVFNSHSKAEDDIIFPALQTKFSGGRKRGRGFLTHYMEIEEELHNEHSGHTTQFNTILEALGPLRKILVDEMVVNSASLDVSSILRLQEQITDLKARVFLHFRKEEEELLPLLSSCFTNEELRVLLGKILGERPSEVLSDFMNIICVGLNEQQRSQIMSEFRSAARGTKFLDWLKFLPRQEAATAEKLHLGDSSLKFPFAAVQNRKNTSDSSQSMEEDVDYGCKHYKRKCRIYASCCSKFFSCRLCHDEFAEANHSCEPIDRYSIDRIKCLICKHEQTVSARCQNAECGVTFAEYFCFICNFFDDDKLKKKYHCPFCNVCRVGSNLGEDFFHCMKCNCCVNTKKRDHKCCDNALSNNCSVCFENLFETTKVIKQLKCGHYMHKGCLSQLLKSDFKCPICRKETVDMSKSWKKLDDSIAQYTEQCLQNNVAIEFEEAPMSCSECGNKGVMKRISHNMRNLPFYPPYKCTPCGSYNTYKQM